MCGSVGIHLAYGEVSCGKTNAVGMALAACYNLEKGFQTYLSDSVARHPLGVFGLFCLCLMTPSDCAVLKQLLIWWD